MADNVLDALRGVPNPKGRAIRYLDLAELDFADAQPDFITHAELQARVTALANAFRALAGHDAPVVTILAPSTIDGLVALLAAEVAGAAHPVNWLLDADGIADCMNAVGADLVVTPGARPGLDTHDKLMAALPRVPSLRGVISTGRVGQGEHSLRALIAGQPGDRLLGRVPGPDDVAALFHTAATTGTSNLLVAVAAADLTTLYRFLSDTVGALDHVSVIDVAPILTGVKRTGLVRPSSL